MIATNYLTITQEMLLQQEEGIAYALLKPEFRRALAYHLVWGKPMHHTLTDIERRLVGCFEKIAAELELHGVVSEPAGEGRG
jgi:hypothetical protein